MSELDGILAQADEPEDEFIGDLSEIEAAQIGALPDGEYLCVVFDVKKDVVKEGKSKGQPKLVIRLKPVRPASNKPIFKHAPLKGPSAGYSRGFLDALGVDTTQPLKLSLIGADEDGNQRHIWLTLRTNEKGDSDISSVRAFDGTFPGADGDELP